MFEIIAVILLAGAVGYWMQEMLKTNREISAKSILLACLTLLLPVAANAQWQPSRGGTSQMDGIVRPEVVRLQKFKKIQDDMKSVTVGNEKRSYWLICNVKADGCITPKSDKNYLLFDKNTRWKMPGATTFLTLAFLQDWTVKYNQAENIGLVAEESSSDDGGIGVFFLDPVTKPGSYAQDTVNVDGPIIYGTGMSDQDRHKAWKHFFMMMVESAARQQGQEALGVKLARRCQPGEEFCTMMIDANLIGIGGIKEPRRVAVIIATDLREKDKQLSRVVCTWPAKDIQVCRDFDTGKLTDTD
jgi:hypothetical protein